MKFKKRINKIKFHPALIFFTLTIIVMIISSVGGILKIESNYYKVNTVAGDLESKVININNLFNRTGIQYLISKLLTNFTTFVPLGTIILGLMGVGVAYKSGFLHTLNKVLEKYLPKKSITFLIVLLGVIFSMFFDVGYVILIPMAAILYRDLGRHPSAGICAAFAGITFGNGAGLVANSLDSSLLPYTKSATKLLDVTYKYHTNGNLIFQLVSTILIAYVGALVTEKIIVPKLGKYNFDEEEIAEKDKIPSSTEIKGLIIAIISIIVILIPLIYCIIPGLPFSGLLLYLKDSNYTNQLFGSKSYFYQGSVFIFSFLLMLAGLVYGLRVKTITNNRDFVDGMNYYLKDLSSILVLIFFAAQFCLIFKQTNIGNFIVALLTNWISNLELTGIVLVLIAFFLTLISTLLVPASATKWAIISPIIVPMFMQSSLTPEFAMAVFRAADSSAKGINPLFTYFVVLLGFLQIYNKKKDDTVTITRAMSLMFPYTIAFTVLWLVIVIAFYILGIPIGIGTNVTI